MFKVPQWILFAVLIAGGVVVWGLIPESRMERLPTFARVMLAVSAIAFGLFTAIGVVCDSGLLRRVIRGRPPQAERDRPRR